LKTKAPDISHIEPTLESTSSKSPNAPVERR
jgi:hypothetical protein